MAGFMERRKFPRFNVKDGACAAFCDTPKRGRIVNISEGGLAFQYYDGGNIETIQSDMIIYIASNGVCVDKIPVKVVSDFEVISDTDSDKDKMRQCGVQFLGMDSYQLSQFQVFMKNYTTGHMHDQRNGSDRRSGNDRRVNELPQYSLFDRRLSKKERRSGIDRRSEKDIPE